MVKNALIAIALLAAVAWGGITVTDRGDHEVLQEMVAGNGDPDTSRIRDVGITYTTTGVGTYDSVCWKLLNYTVDTVIDAGKFRETVSAGTYTDTIQDVPSPHVASIADTGAWYRIAVYGHTGADIDSSRGTNKWGVGLNVALWGHSKLVYRNNGVIPHGQITASDNSGLSVRKYAGQWFPGAKISGDWMDTTNYGSTTATTLVPQLINRLIDSTHRLFGVTGYARGGSALNPIVGIHYWRLRNAANPIDTSAVSGSERLYGFLLRSAQSINPLISIGYCGGVDAGNGIWQKDSIKKTYDSIFTWLDTDLGYSMEHFIVPENDCKYSTDYANAPMLSIMEAQQEMNGTKRYTVPHNYDMADFFGDYVHPGPVAQDTIAARTGDCIAKLINGKIGGGYRGPYVTGSNVVTRGVVRLSFGLQTGRKLVMDSMSRITVKSKYFDSIKKASFALESDSASVKLTLNHRVMVNDSIKYGYDREKSALSIIRDNYGLPAERKAHTWYPVTTSADSLAAATDRYWVGADVDTQWTSATAWSATSGGAGGAGAPDSTCDVIIDGNNAKCVLMGASKCRSFYIAPTHTKYFKDRANTMGIECDFVFSGDSLLQSGAWTLKLGSWYSGVIKSGNPTRLCKIDLKDDGMFITKTATANYGPLTCAYPGKKTDVSCVLTSGGSRILHLKGGQFNILDYFTLSLDSSTVPMDTVFGSTITAASSFSFFAQRASLYGTPATYSIMPFTSETGLNFTQTRTEGKVTSIMTMSGPIAQTIVTSVPTSFSPSSGAAFKFLTNNHAVSTVAIMSIVFPATSTYQYYDFGTSAVTSKGFKTSGTIDKDTLAIGWNHSCGGSFILHDANIRVILNNPTTTLNGTSADSIAVSGLSIGNVVINKSANGTKQVGVARYTNLTLTDGTFTQQAATDTVQAVNATVNTTDAVTNVAPWNISNKLTVATGVTLTVPSLIIGGTTEAPDTIQGAGAGATLTGPQDTLSHTYVALLTCTNPLYLDSSANTGGNNTNVRSLSYTGATLSSASGLPGDTIGISTGNGLVGGAASIGDSAVTLTVVNSDSGYIVVPLAMPVGTYDVGLSNSDGDTLTLLGALEVETGLVPIVGAHIYPSISRKLQKITLTATSGLGTSGLKVMIDGNECDIDAGYVDIFAKFRAPNVRNGLYDVLIINSTNDTATVRWRCRPYVANSPW